MSESEQQSQDQPERFATLRRWHERAHSNPITSLFTKVVVTIIGLAVFTMGVIMMVTPGPGIVGIILGLAILATEWAWAEKAMLAAKAQAQKAADKAKEMDPAVRRRRILGTLMTCLVTLGLIWMYVALYDWPSWSVASWDKAQSMVRFLPDLPGM